MLGQIWSKLSLTGWTVLQVGRTMGLHPNSQQSGGPQLYAATRLLHIKHPVLVSEEETLLAMTQVCMYAVARALTDEHTYTHIMLARTRTHTHTQHTQHTQHTCTQTNKHIQKLIWMDTHTYTCAHTMHIIIRWLAWSRL